jgi:hypothetical protein
MKKKKNSSHYIDNEKFLEELVSWKQRIKDAALCDEPKPPISSYIGMAFLEIAQNLAKKPNFINYHFKDDMIGDAVENCLMYCENFDESKSKNPFSYFTQITYFAFLRRIQKEKKQNYVKYKYLKSMDVNGDLTDYFQKIGLTEDDIKIYDKLEKTIEEDKSAKSTKRKKKIKLLEEE